jgi:hypothetical protein
MDERQLGQMALMSMYEPTPPVVVERTQLAMLWTSSGRSDAQSAMIDLCAR